MARLIASQAAGDYVNADVQGARSRSHDVPTNAGIAFKF
jgi:hypothetical protein